MQEDYAARKIQRAWWLHRERRSSIYSQQKSQHPLCVVTGEDVPFPYCIDISHVGPILSDITVNSPKPITIALWIEYEPKPILKRTVPTGATTLHPCGTGLPRHLIIYPRLILFLSRICEVTLHWIFPTFGTKYLQICEQFRNLHDRILDL